jgi:DNA replication ATP-dependent helicase Dna2
MNVDAADAVLSQAIQPTLAPVKSEEEEDAELWDEVDDTESLPPSQAPKPARPVLPAAIDELRSCKNCYAAEGCMLYRRAVDKVSYLPVDDGQDGKALQEIYDDRVGHLIDEQCDFFEKWERLITLEEREMVRFKKEIWTMTAHERQRHGRCLADMVIDTNFAAAGAQPESDKPGAYRFKYRLVRSGNPPPPPQTQFGTAPPASQAARPQSLTGGQLSVGDPVVVSIEPSVLALARGYVLGIQTEFIDLGLDHSITALPGDACDGFAPTSGQILGNIVYRIDKDELQSGMGKIRDNLAQLFYAKGDEKRRRLIVDLEKPRFRLLELADQRAVKGEHLNTDQKEAVNKVLTAQDYALILGMPGTGKTTTVAEIIKALVAQGKSILLTSYTHSAVDNILAKVQDLEDVKMLRLGNPDKVSQGSTTAKIGHLLMLYLRSCLLLLISPWLACRLLPRWLNSRIVTCPLR